MFDEYLVQMLVNLNCLEDCLRRARDAVDSEALGLVQFQYLGDQLERAQKYLKQAIEVMTVLAALRGPDEA